MDERLGKAHGEEIIWESGKLEPCTNYGYPMVKQLIRANDRLIWRTNYIGWKYTAPWWKKFILLDGSGYEYIAHQENELVTQSVADKLIVRYM